MLWPYQKDQGLALLSDPWIGIEVPEPKTAKNRIHWDVESDDVEALLGRGARLLRAADDEISWSVLADPEGNEFCVFPPT